jgi:hypothetical protein
VELKIFGTAIHLRSSLRENLTDRFTQGGDHLLQLCPRGAIRRE